MRKLPIWVRPATIPATTDSESASVIEMTYKLYNTMQELITEYNTFAENVNKQITDFETKYEGDIEIFTTSLRQEFQDFIDIVDLKIKDFETHGAQIDELRNEIETLKGTINSYSSEIESLKNNVENLTDQVVELIVDPIVIDTFDSTYCQDNTDDEGYITLNLSSQPEVYKPIYIRINTSNGAIVISAKSIYELDPVHLSANGVNYSDSYICSANINSNDNNLCIDLQLINMGVSIGQIHNIEVEYTLSKSGVNYEF